MTIFDARTSNKFLTVSLILKQKMKIFGFIKDYSKQLLKWFDPRMRKNLVVSFLAQGWHKIFSKNLLAQGRKAAE